MMGEDDELIWLDFWKSHPTTLSSLKCHIRWQFDCCWPSAVSFVADERGQPHVNHYGIQTLRIHCFLKEQTGVGGKVTRAS